MKIPFDTSLLGWVTDSATIVERFEENVEKGYRLIESCLLNGGTVFSCGNGGSMADSCHFAAELTGRFKRKDRKPLRGLALGTNLSEVTAIGNDFGFENIFSRPLSIFAKPGDILIGFSTSGMSPNVVKAWNYAATHGMKTIALTGETGAQYAQVNIVVPSKNTARIQELHQKVYHLWCENLDDVEW